MDIKDFENKRWSSASQKIEFRHMAALSLVNGVRVLDVGCGDGLLMGLLEKQGAYVTGADISDVAIQKCEQKGFKVRKISGSHLPFDDNSFDLVIALDVLEHLYAPGELLREMARVSLGGNVIVGVPNFSSLPARIQVLRGRVPENNSPHKGHIYWFNLQSLIRVIKKEGMRVDVLMVNTIWEDTFLLGALMRICKALFPGFFALSFVARLQNENK